MVLRAGSTAPTPRSPAGLTGGGQIPWVHDHLEGHLLPAGLDISTLQQLIDTAASIPLAFGNTTATDTNTSGNGLAFMLPTAAATAGTNSLASPSACGTTGMMGTGTCGGTGTGTVGLAMAALVASAAAATGAAGLSTGAASTAQSTLEGSNPHHLHHPHGAGGGAGTGGQQRALSLIAVFGPFAARGAPAGSTSRGGLFSCGTSRTVTDNTAAAQAAAILSGTSTSSVSAPYGLAGAPAGSSYLLRAFGAVGGGLGATATTSGGACEDAASAAAAAAAAMAVVTSGGAVDSGASVVAPEASVLAREHAQLLLRLCEPEELTSDLTGLSVIGQGSQSVAFQALWRGARVVVKFSACASLDTSSSYSVVRQALVSKALSHPNVIQHYSVRCCQLVGSSHFMNPISLRSVSGLPPTAASETERAGKAPAHIAGAPGSSVVGLRQAPPPPEPVTARQLSAGSDATPVVTEAAAVAAEGAEVPALDSATPGTAGVGPAGTEGAAEGAGAVSDTADAALRTPRSSQRLFAAAGPVAALIAAGYTAGDATGDAAPMVITEQVDPTCAAAPVPDSSSTIATTITLAPFLSPLAMSSAAVQHCGGSTGLIGGSAASAEGGAIAGAATLAAGAAARFSSLFGSSAAAHQHVQQHTHPAGDSGAGPAPGSILSTAGCCTRRLQAPVSPLPPVNFSAPTPTADADSVELHRLHSVHSCSSSTAVLEDSLMNTAYQQHQQHQQLQQAAPAGGAASGAPRLLPSKAALQPQSPFVGAADVTSPLDVTLVPSVRTRPAAPVRSERSSASVQGPESVSSDATTSHATPTMLNRQGVPGREDSSRTFATPFLSGASMGLGLGSSSAAVTQSGELGGSPALSSPQQPTLALRNRAAGLFSGPAPSRHVAGGSSSASRARSQQQPYASQPPPLEVISERDQLLAELATFPLAAGSTAFGGGGDGSSKSKRRSLRSPPVAVAAVATPAAAGIASHPSVGSAVADVSTMEGASSASLRTKAQQQPPPSRSEQELRDRPGSTVTSEQCVLTRTATADIDAALAAELPGAAAPDGLRRAAGASNGSCAGSMVSGPAGMHYPNAAGQAVPRGHQAAELVPALPGVTTGGAGMSGNEHATNSAAVSTGEAVTSTCVDAVPWPAQSQPTSVAGLISEALATPPSPVTASSPDRNAAPAAATVAAVAALPPPRSACVAASATSAKGWPKPMVASPEARAAPTAPVAAPKAAANAPDGVSPAASLSFNSYEGFGNPYGGSGAHALSLSHVAALLSARQGEYLTAVLMEHADKSTLQAAVQRGLFKENRVWSSRVALRALLRTALEVCFALQHLHSRSVVHGALRPANVLLKSSNLDRRGFTAKVANFSLARVCCGRSVEDHVMEPLGLASVATAEAAAAAVAAGGRMRQLHCREGKALGGGGEGGGAASTETSLEDSRVMMGAAGAGEGAGGDETSTPKKMSRATANALPFWAPEQLCGVVGKASDVYAFGVLVYVMCVGNLPYAGVPVEQVVMGVANGTLRPTWPDSPPTIEQALAPQVRQLCAQCWQQDPRARPPFSALCAALQAIENSVRQQLRTGPTQQPQPQQQAPSFETTSAFSGPALAMAASACADGGSRPPPANAAASNTQTHQQSVSGNVVSAASVSKTGTATSVSKRTSGRASTAGPGTSPLGRSGNTTTGSMGISGTAAPQPNASVTTSSSAATVAEAVAGGLCVVRKGNGGGAVRRRSGPEAASSVAVGTLGEMRRS
ncbi:hypothetical protein HYH02_006325 [Chlamydomonas schloesseri]|uniref:Protein kinase domain-containing protein n=1 Tax=Chlamydomonas schloesseri TaxID=2026947 RepID=A0A836B601_9CHLO|nr:hypothetical protein HYH02_006325 [Chlamydomonas schloesseri]|eukprot:KAG2448433.1 hypothetical protein HYH02_006325 [Chlamydomonas schloesseri]